MLLYFQIILHFDFLYLILIQNNLLFFILNFLLVILLLLFIHEFLIGELLHLFLHTLDTLLQYLILAV